MYRIIERRRKMNEMNNNLSEKGIQFSWKRGFLSDMKFTDI